MIEPNTTHVQFDATPDELVDVHLRFLRASKAASSARHVNRIVVAAVIGLIVFLLIQLLPRPVFVASIIAAVVAALTSYATYPRDYERGARRRIARLLTEQFGNGQSFTCEVELRPQGIWLRQAAIEVLYAWRTVRSIEDTPDGVLFRFTGGLLMVRSRAFATQGVREQFLAQSRELATQAAA